MLKISNFLKEYSNGINEIKLKDLLTLNDLSLLEQKIQTIFPPTEIGSITLVDQIVLLSLLKLIQARNILEVGTFFGYSTTLFALNTDAKIYSIDLPEEECEEVIYNEKKALTDGDYNDDLLRSNQANKGPYYLDILPQIKKNKVKLIKQNSTTIDFLNDIGELDFVFIDGGHSYEIISSDTSNALRAVRKGVIIWHDYTSHTHSDVTKYLDELNDLKIFHIKNSLCAFSFIGMD